ncbi:MAG TPA: (2Fe-2S) ferredoxin domain-containing protein [Armatimonadota bacterium]
MPEKLDLYLCMGSACHQMGVYEVLPKVQALLAERELEVTVELKGAFCLGPCTDGIVMKFGDRLFTHITPANVERKFTEEILPCLT